MPFTGQDDGTHPRQLIHQCARVHHGHDRIRTAMPEVDGQGDLLRPEIPFPGIQGEFVQDPP